MAAANSGFHETVRRQIALNRARTPTERFRALCDLLDAARAMAPRDHAARERRGRIQAARQKDREKLRDHFRRLLAGDRPEPPERI